RAAEEAHDRPRPAGGVGLAPAERAEDRVARVLFGPRDGEAAGVRAQVVANQRFVRAVVPTLGTSPGDLARVASRAVVRVGAADEAHAERVRPERALECEPVLERLAHEVPARVLVDRQVGRERALLLVRQLLEGAELVARADAGACEPIVAALGVPLHLM